MKKEGVLKIAKTLLPFLVGILFIYLSVRTTTAEDRATIYAAIKDADYRFIFLSLIMGLLSHFSRAYRWNFMLHPLGYRPRLVNNTLAIFITYIANLGVPRSGELFRATVMQTYEGIPFEKSFGTIIAERTVDLLMLFLTIGIALTLEFDLIFGMLQEKAMNPWTLLFGFSVGAGVFYLVYAQIKRSESAWAKKNNRSCNRSFRGVFDAFAHGKKVGLLGAHPLYLEHVCRHVLHHQVFPPRNCCARV